MVRLSHLRVLVAGSVLALALVTAHAEVASSPGFVIQQSTLSIAGEPASSTSFVISASMAQPATIGTSSSPTYLLQSGFWSFVAQGLVPVLLIVDPGSTQATVDLQWSGNQDPFQVYQSTDCGGVFLASPTQISANQLVDVETLPGLTCFNVLSTAPGPAPPP